MTVAVRAWTVESRQLALEVERSARARALEVAGSVERFVSGASWPGMRLAGEGAPPLPPHACDASGEVARLERTLDAILARDGIAAAEAWVAARSEAAGGREFGWAKLRRAGWLEGRGQLEAAQALRLELVASGGPARDGRGVRVDLAARALLLPAAAEQAGAEDLVRDLDGDLNYLDEWGTAALLGSVLARAPRVLAGRAEGADPGVASIERRWLTLRRDRLDASIPAGPAWIRDRAEGLWLVVPTEDLSGARAVVAADVLSSAIPGITRELLEDSGFGVGLLTADGERLQPLRGAAVMASASLPAGLGRVDIVESVPGAALHTLRRRQRTWFSLVAAGLFASLLGGVIGLRALARQEQLQRDREGFVAAVSHELKTPLTATRLLGELLERGDLDEAKVREFGGRIARESERLDQMVRGVLDLSRLERLGLERGRAARIRPTELLDAALQRSAALLSEAGARAVIVAPAAGIGRVEVDREALVGALVNLVENAVRHGRPELGSSGAFDGPDVQLAVVEHTDRIRFEVRDRGPGVDARERSRIFGEFQRGGDEDTRRTRGAGIGLALVARIAAAHGGRAFVDPRLGGGSVFTIELPRAREESIA